MGDDERVKLTNDDVEYGSFDFANDVDHSDFNRIMSLVNDNLSEPYCIYVYRFFLNNWPQLCHVARLKATGEIIGVIISKVEAHRGKKIRGYIGMLTILSQYRGNGLAKSLIDLNIDTMVQRGCDEIMLETEVVNINALRLYEQFGFIRVKRLYRYYVNTHDAYRLILPITQKAIQRSVFLPELDQDDIPVVLY